MTPPTGFDPPALVDSAIVVEIDRAIGRDALAGLVYRHLDGVARALELVEGWCASGQWTEVRREAHRLKGSAATLGFVRLSELWVDVESRSARAESADVRRLVARIRAVHLELRGWAASRFTTGIGAA
jgi:HPt (histidine-containing phosphotransfer) domain-containing protein